MVYVGELCAKCPFIKYIFTSVQAGGSCKWVNDSQRLLLEFFDIIHDSPSQIYHSALPFCPSSSWLHKYYNVALSQNVRVVKGLLAQWGVCFRTVTLGAAPWAIACWKDTIAVGCETGDITILGGITGSQTAVLSGHTQGVRSLTFSSDGTFLVSGSNDKTVKLWDMQTGGVVKTFDGHTSFVRSVSISADCTIIISASKDKTIRLWDIQMKECCHVIEQKEEVDHVNFSPTDSQSFVSTSGGILWQWNISGHQINPTHDGSCVAFPLDQIQLVLCQGMVAAVKHFDSRQLSGCCCLFPGGRFVAVAAGTAINIWDITSSDPNLVKTFVGQANHISSLAFSSPSSLISSSYDESVRFWQIGDLLMDQVMTNQTPPLASAPIKFITLQAEDGITISGDSNGVVNIWDLSTGHCKASFQTPAQDYHRGTSRLINGRLTFVWHVEKKIHIWDMEMGELQIVDAVLPHIEDVRISSDGSRVFCLQWESIQTLSILTGELISEVKLEYSQLRRSLIMDGLRVWVHSSIGELQGWDFGIPGSLPIQLPTTPLPHLNNPTLCLSKIKNIVTGKGVFRLGGRFVRPVNSQWDGRYLAAGYESGEVLILDFNYVL